MRLFKWIISIVSLGLVLFSMQASAEEEKTYSISLVKTANLQQQVHKIGDKKVLAEIHKVKEGEHVWQILRKKGLLKDANIPELLAILKELNKSFRNLDLIHPGEKLLIPLKIVPIAGSKAPRVVQSEVKVTVPELGDIELETYTVRPGDNIVRIVTGKYSIPPARLYTEYLSLVKRLNPALKDLNRIYPGQQIKIPIYSPQVVRKPIAEKKPPQRPTLVGDQDKANPAWKDLKNIFTMMDEEWIQEGEHFIPLRSGGQIDLKASSFPIVSLLNGRRIIVDIYHKLPERMARLIEASWGNYKVVQLDQDDSLAECLAKMFKATGYPKILDRGQPLQIQGKFPVSVSGDWVVVRSEEPMEKHAHIIVITLLQTGEPPLYSPLRRFLAQMGIKVIEYPLELTQTSTEKVGVDVIETGEGLKPIAKTLLKLTAHQFSEDVEIPVYGSQQKDFNLIIKADLFFNNSGIDTIIDFSGLGGDVTSFLEEHQFQVLSLHGQGPGFMVVKKILDFLGTPNDAGNHSFLGADRDTSRNIKISIAGVVFSDSTKSAIFAIQKGLPLALQEFLCQKGFRLLEIPQK